MKILKKGERDHIDQLLDYVYGELGEEALFTYIEHLIVRARRKALKEACIALTQYPQAWRIVNALLEKK